MNKFIKNINKLLYIIFLVLIVFSVLYIIKYSHEIHESKQQQKLLSEISIPENTSLNENINSEESATDNSKENEIVNSENNPEIDVNSKNERMLQIEELQKINSDIVGWIEIENTDINYPVLQSTDNSYYMNHNYKKEYSSNGSIFLDKAYNWDIPSSNLLIYGHNMKNNTMFQDLLKYKNKDFYVQHPSIRFTTNNEDAYYDIISVFESRVYYKSEQNVFRYYFFVNSKSVSDYNEFVANAKNASLYDIDKTAVYGDQLLTLSTCSYHTKDGRFAVVAKKATKN